ncbi:MAG: hypothetical protein ACLR4C_04830 [Eubacterium ventriosum]
MKIQQLIELKDKYKFEVMLDGACSPERVETLSKLGVKGFILELLLYLEKVNHTKSYWMD